MGLISLWKKITYRTEDKTSYSSLERRSGEIRPAWDQRGIYDPLPPEQPQAIDTTDIRLIR